MSLKQHLTNLLGNLWQKKAEIQLPEPVEPDIELAVKAEAKALKSHKLDEPKQIYLCKLIGYGFTTKEIASELKESFGIEIGTRMINKYKKDDNWEPTIRKFRQEYVSLFDDVPGFHKKIRLVRMEKVIEKAEEEGDWKRVIEATEHQRKEIEGSGDINISLVSNRYYNMSDEELAKREDELIHILNQEGKKVGNERTEAKAD